MEGLGFMRSPLLVLQTAISSGMEPAVLSVASPAPQIAVGSGALFHLTLEEPKSLLFSLLTSSYSLAGLAFVFIFQHSAGSRTVLWGRAEGSLCVVLARVEL